MSVAEIGALHARYVRLADRFKSVWAYHQFATGVFRNFLSAPLPYELDFSKINDRIKGIGPSLSSSQTAEANAAIALSDLALDRAATVLLRADDQISASIMRRFFEKLRKQDETIIHQLIKFYLFAEAVDGDRRDKLDFLFTSIGEELSAERGEYRSRDSLEFRERITALVSALRLPVALPAEATEALAAIRGMRDEIVLATSFSDLTTRNLLRNARVFKHRLGQVYFHPDVLLAVVELNVTTKNRFLKLYAEEEQRLIADAEKLIEHGQAIERNFGETNPELVDEIARFRRVKEQFDESRATSNVKYDVIAQMKASMDAILKQLDRGMADDVESSDDLPPAFYSDAELLDKIRDRFPLSSDDLEPFLVRIAAAVESATSADDAQLRDLRLEQWEIDAYEKLYERKVADSHEDTDDLWMLYLRGAALRIKVDAEATSLAAAMAAGVLPQSDLLDRAKVSLDCAKELDQAFADRLHKAVYFTNPKLLHELYRSRFRLLRGFSGLWLIYDRQQ